MISMDFLSKSVAGTEFIDFQNDNFYKQMKACFKEHIRQVDGRPVLEPSVEEPLLKLIATYTGFTNITFEFMDEGNLWVDTGYFSPSHVLNNDGVDRYFSTSQTTLYRWYQENKVKIFKGRIDYSTGRVGGSFCTIPIKLGICRYMENYFPAKQVAKYGEPLEGLMAGALCHELGHAFSGCVMLLTLMEDNIVAQAALNAYRNSKRTEDRVVVLKDTATILGLKPSNTEDLLEFAKGENDESFMLYFTKMTSQRNSQRALSVGVPNMTSEVLADMYAIRMGCSKGIVAAIGTMIDRGIIVPLVENFLMSCSMAVLGMYGGIVTLTLIGGSYMAIVPIMAFVFSLSFIIGFFNNAYSGVYNADHRRMEDAIRQLIAKVKEDKKMPAKDRADLVKDITVLLDANKKIQPWYEGTALYRTMGWVFSGSDFKRREVEHYTQALNNHELTVLSEQLKGV